MPLKDLARTFIKETVPRERLRRANPGATVSSSVLFLGDHERVRLADGVFVQGPTSLIVTDGGGLRGASLTVGPRTYIGEQNNIRCAGASIEIGADCLISQQITIVGSNHGRAPGALIVEQAWEGSGVIIGDDVWIGAGAKILAGARIASGAIVAANAVVAGPVGPGEIVGGMPARVIGHRE